MSSCNSERLVGSYQNDNLPIRGRGHHIEKIAFIAAPYLAIADETKIHYCDIKAQTIIKTIEFNRPILGLEATENGDLYVITPSFANQQIMISKITYSDYSLSLVRSLKFNIDSQWLLGNKVKFIFTVFLELVMIFHSCFSIIYSIDLFKEKDNFSPIRFFSNGNERRHVSILSNGIVALWNQDDTLIMECNHTTRPEREKPRLS